MDEFLQIVALECAADPNVILDAMVAQQLKPTKVACEYATEAARILGERWLSDELSFVDVTIRTERLHGLVRRVDEMVVDSGMGEGPSALILVPEAEQHTLGAFVLALQLRLEGFSAVVRVAPVAADLTELVTAKGFDLALVSIGCAAALDSSIGLVRTLRLMSRREIPIYVGGAIPLQDDVLLQMTGADRVLRHVSALLADYQSFLAHRALDREVKASQSNVAISSKSGARVGK